MTPPDAVRVCRRRRQVHRTRDLAGELRATLISTSNGARFTITPNGFFAGSVAIVEGGRLAVEDQVDLRAILRPPHRLGVT
jgi:hypothetical protein